MLTQAQVQPLLLSLQSRRGVAGGSWRKQPWAQPQCQSLTPKGWHRACPRAASTRVRPLRGVTEPEDNEAVPRCDTPQAIQKPSQVDEVPLQLLHREGPNSRLPAPPQNTSTSPGRLLVYRGGGRTELANESEVNGTRFGPESKARRAGGMGQDLKPLLKTCGPSPDLEHLGSLLKHLVGSPISCGRTTTVFYEKKKICSLLFLLTLPDIATIKNRPMWSQVSCPPLFLSPRKSNRTHF